MRRHGRGPGADPRRRRSCSTTTPCCALADELEGHPDNVAACLLGGSDHRLDRRRHGAGRSGCRLDPSPASRPVVFVPAVELSTTARPASCCRRPCRTPTPPRNAGRAALLVEALTRRPRPAARRHRGPAAPAVPGAGACRAAPAWWPSCAPPASPRWSPAPGRACWRSRSPADRARPLGWRRRAGRAAAGLAAGGAHVLPLRTADAACAAARRCATVEVTVRDRRRACTGARPTAVVVPTSLRLTSARPRTSGCHDPRPVSRGRDRPS